MFPWTTTIGTNTMDRHFPDVVKLGIRTLTRVSLYKGRKPLLLKKFNSSNFDSELLCMEGTLDPYFVARKILICD